jgi:hypothetical protein
MLKPYRSDAAEKILSYFEKKITWNTSILKESQNT